MKGTPMEIKIVPAGTPVTFTDPETGEEQTLPLGHDVLQICFSIKIDEGERKEKNHETRNI